MGKVCSPKIEAFFSKESNVNFAYESFSKTDGQKATQLDTGPTSTTLETTFEYNAAINSYGKTNSWLSYEKLSHIRTSRLIGIKN